MKTKPTVVLLINLSLSTVWYFTPKRYTFNSGYYQLVKRPIYSVFEGAKTYLLYT
ncbi:hypothetical protein I6N90_11270 [Paenibacillus sp. GSMTC-2017]|uniref:hypothetical protein n=1 Tax=Paenibacillus sp. GSMTC-2017 TaxID=2794350 RepID=UPI0018D5FE98|nr:hypothetical protein [Paenibacillus sp. GSMTC-2017]MBH5318388.1 hypothetical protein [Paenibacillus sp. GSMTC-2017]